MRGKPELIPIDSQFRYRVIRYRVIRYRVIKYRVIRNRVRGNSLTTKIKQN